MVKFESEGEVIGQRFLGNESHVEHFKLLERATTSILIGARNAIYNISLHDLTEIVDQHVSQLVDDNAQ
ncbi:semaphorin-1A-like [Apis mellifera carnica]|nr:semaphorin-1A-like [Apis mellifera carnica]